MKITRISVFQKDLPLEHPYWLSGGRLRFEVLDATFVKLETDEGVIGWGEGTPWGHTYVPAHGPGIRAGIETVATFVLGLDPRKVLDVERAMDLALPGHLYAKSPIDMACWDIAGQAAGLPIADLMGGGSRRPQPIASSVGAKTVNETRDVLERYRSRGYVAHSVKIGGDVDRDIARIRDVESLRRDGEIMLYDVNRGWSRQQALRVMSATEDLNVMFEQPGETLDDIAAIRGLHSAPVSVDESLVTLQDATRIARDGLAEVFGIKLNRVGGLTKAARLRDVALAHGIDMFVMATGGSVLADTEALHLAATVPDNNMMAVWACQDMITADVAGGAARATPPGICICRRIPGWACILMKTPWALRLQPMEVRMDGVMAPAVQTRPGLRITGLSLWHVPLTSHETYYMAEGKTCATVETVVLRVETSGGISGWGEVCPIPHYLPAYARGVAPALTEMSEALLGADPVGPEALMDKMAAYLPGHDYAKSALDIALWDITGQAAGLPLYALLGGRRSEDLPLYHSITCIDPHEMARIAQEAQRAGMTQFQAKLGADANNEADIARLRLVREAVGPGPIVYGDWNCGATRLDATRVGRAVADIDVMLEQPCATLEDCAAVRVATGLPMKIDELAHDTASLLKAHGLGILDAVAVKLSKFGGLSAARRARDLSYHLGPRMCIECTWGSDIATAAALHLGAATRPTSVLNVCDLSGYVSPRLAPDAPIRQAGRIKPPEGPGLGVRPDLDALGTPDLDIR